MTIEKDVRYAISPSETKSMDTEALRENFLIQEVFSPGRTCLTYTMYDRYMSVHAGAGITNYTFIWRMAGENLNYNDMDGCQVTELR